jgi:hypothetical protein
VEEACPPHYEDAVSCYAQLDHQTNAEFGRVAPILPYLERQS